MAKTLANEFGADGITVNNVCPGYTLTDRLTELFETRATRCRRRLRPDSEAIHRECAHRALRASGRTGCAGRVSGIGARQLHQRHHHRRGWRKHQRSSIIAAAPRNPKSQIPQSVLYYFVLSPSSTSPRGAKNDSDFRTLSSDCAGRIVRHLFVALALLIPALGRADEPYARSRDYDLQNVKTHLWFDTDQRKVRGEVTHSISMLRDDVAQIQFDSVELKIAGRNPRWQGCEILHHRDMH